MMIGRSRYEVGDDRVYIHVFGLRLSPSTCSSLFLSLSSSSFVFQKSTCAQAHHMCDGRARISSFSSSSSLPDMLYNHSNIAFRCVCMAKEDEHVERKT